VADIHAGTAILKRVYSQKYTQILKVVAFFYGYGVPLGIASCMYNICNNNGHHLVPSVMGGYYATTFTLIDDLHQARYYNVKDERILWINGYNHSLKPLIPVNVTYFISIVEH
jgi:hypothetical protein